MAALKNPKPGEEQLIRDKAKRIFQVAADNDVKIFIVGAWGCGVFRNNPHFIAETFKYLLDNEFKDVFEAVIFAIPDKGGKNYQVFDSYFGETTDE